MDRTPGRDMSATGRPELGVYDYLQMLWRRKLVIIAAVVLVVVVVVGLDTRKVRVYEGTASLLLTPSFSGALSAAGTGSLGASTVDAPTAVKVIQSQATANAAAASLKLKSVPSASAAQAGTTSVVSVTVRSTDPAFAAKVANAYANAYIVGQQTQAINSLTDASTQISSRISSLDQQLQTVQGQISDITSHEQPAQLTNGSPGPPQPTPTQAAQLASLALQQTTLNDQQTAFKQELSQLQVAANLAGGGGQLVSPAFTDRTPVSPKTFRDTIIAIGLGLALGLGIALLREVLDTRIRGKEELERVGQGLPVMGLIPKQPEWRNRSRAIIASVERPESSAAEAYRSLRTSIQFLGIDRPIHSLQITSPTSSEGKTTTLVNLAIALAKAGQRVVIVDCDLRRPRVHQFFDLDQERGLTSVLLGEVPLSDALQTVVDVGWLRVLTSGRTPPNPSELLSGRPTSDIFASLCRETDYVLVDSPPLLPVSDGAVIAARVDATLLVVSDNQTRRKPLSRALEMLDQIDARVIGTVLNGVTRDAGGYGYSYGYGYYRPYVAGSSPSNGNGGTSTKANGKSREHAGSNGQSVSSHTSVAAVSTAASPVSSGEPTEGDPRDGKTVSVASHEPGSEGTATREDSIDRLELEPDR